MGAKVLVVDDEEVIRVSVSEILSEEGYKVDTASTLKEAKDKLSAEFFHLVLLDVWMPDGDGVDFIPTLKDLSPESNIVIITGHGSVETAVKALKRGAFDFIEKPFSVERLVLTVKHACEDVLRRTSFVEEEQEELIGNSPKILEIKRLIPKIAKSKAPVLILGESGTGKELVARLIHKYSGRKGNFVDINCASIPSDLVESELFGHERGAFTGAVSRKKGKFEIADRGTLFLDEIGDLDIRSQAKLLRVIETGSFTRLGGTQKIEVDVRILSASNKDIRKEVEKGNFREDLYYRISVFTLELPPLRERGEDVILLAEYFLKKFAREYGKDCMELSDEVKELLLNHRWKGNVRELKNLMERLVILCDGEKIKPDHLSLGSVRAYRDLSRLLEMDDLKTAKREFEKIFIEQKLREFDYDLKKVARSIGLDLSNLYRKIKAYGIEIRSGR